MHRNFTRPNPRSTTGPGKPQGLAKGTQIVLLDGNKRGKWLKPKTVTECMIYKIESHESYFNTYGSSLNRFSKWDEFIVIINDYGKPVKMNLNRFKLL